MSNTNNNDMEQFNVAIDRLRDDIKEVKADGIRSRTENREDIRALTVKTDNWQQEVRTRFDGVEDRLTIIETQTSTKEGLKSYSAVHWQTWAAICLCIISTIGIGISNYWKAKTFHDETVQTIQHNHEETLKKVEVTAEQAVEQAKKH